MNKFSNLKNISLKWLVLGAVVLGVLLAVFYLVFFNAKDRFIDLSRYQVGVAERVQNSGLVVPLPAAGLSLTLEEGSLTVGEEAEVEVRLDVDSEAKISVVEGRIKYDPNFIRIKGVVTRSLLSKASDKDDSQRGIYSFSFYKKDGEPVSQSLGIATVTIEPLKKGQTALSLLFKEDTVDTSLVMTFSDAENILKAVKNLDITIK